MTHPLVEILARIKAEYESAVPTVFTEGDIVMLLDERDAKELDAFEARDLAIATAVRDAILERNRLGWEKLPALNLAEIIEGVE